MISVSIDAPSLIRRRSTQPIRAPDNQLADTCRKAPTLAPSVLTFCFYGDHSVDEAIATATHGALNAA